VLLTQYFAGDKIEKSVMGGACSTHGGEAYTKFLWEKRPHVRHKRRSEDNIKMDLQEVGVRTGSNWLRIGTGGGHL